MTLQRPTVQPIRQLSSVTLAPEILNQLQSAASNLRAAVGFSPVLLTGNPSTTADAAEAIARETGKQLVRIDLAAITSKYIGETEKNLDRILASADPSQSILFFDEADSLFGKRTEVQDSHDRYANTEITYLLQRLESFHGTAILATREPVDTPPDRPFRHIIRLTR